MSVLPSFMPALAVTLQTADTDFSVDWIDVRRDAPAPEFFRGDERGTRVCKEIDDDILGFRACSDNAFNALERFLSVAPRHILVHAVKHLLNVDPDVASPDVV